MHRKFYIDKPGGRVRHLPPLLVAAGLVCLYIVGMCAIPAATFAGGIPGGNISDPSVRAVDIAKPAVVRIITQLNGHLTVHFSATQNITFPQNAAGYGLAALGSGTFITARGDILTADHVVRPPKNQELTTVLIQAAAADVAAYYNQTVKPGSQVTPDQMTQLLTSGQIASDANFDTPVSAAYLSTDYTGPLSATRLADVPPQIYAPVDRIEQESAVDQKDVAIIHVNMNDMATVQLGDSSAVQQQDNLTIIGFPGNGDISNRPTDLLTSSVNKIFVSSMKTTSTGAQVIQVGGNVEQGDSGGPALDAQGRVVGIVSFGAPGGTSFLQASNSARQLIQAQNLDTTPGPFQQAWSQAFNDYGSSAPGHWHKAQQEFASIAARYPQFKAITPYLNYAKGQAQHEQVPQSHPKTNPAPSTTNALPWPLIIGGGAALAILLLALSGAAVVRGRRRKAREQAQAPGGPPQARVPQAGAPAAPVMAQPSYSQPPPFVPRPGPNSYGVPPPQRVPPQPAPPGSVSAQAFGAPPVSPLSPSNPAPGAGTRTGDATVISANSPAAPSGILRPWPCGHMNRSNARYCSICGEPAPPPPTVRRFEQ